MCRTQCVLALVTLTVGLAHSWDIAVTVTGEQLVFFDNEGKNHTEKAPFRDLTAFAYDAVNNILLFVDRQSDASIFSFSISSKKYQSLVKKKGYENIQGLAFDPVTGLLFWTDTNEKTINSLSLKPGSDPNGKLLFKMDDELPSAIAVDSCRGYVYWTNTNSQKPTIERSRFDGTEREVIVNSTIHKMYMPVSLAIDQQTKKMFWADDQEGIYYSIESADLDGTNRRTLYSGIYYQPNAVTVSKDFIYWVHRDQNSVWRLPKNPAVNEEPIDIFKFNSETHFGIVANYKIEDQTKGTTECDALKSLSQNDSAIYESFNIPTDADLFCVHGMKVSGQLFCNCSSGYTGERCDISVCQNYCFQGDCSVDGKGQPKCRCNSGFSGERCEVNACHGYCLNYGICSLDHKSEPQCQCIGDYEGSRCEAAKIFTTTTEATTTTVTPTSTSTVTPTSTSKVTPTSTSKITPTSINQVQAKVETNASRQCYSGERCEVNACHGYCLNYGICSLDHKSEPQCQCIGDYEGSRCEAAKIFTTTTEAATTTVTPTSTNQVPAKVETNASCQCNETRSTSRSAMSMSSDNFNLDTMIEGCANEWDTVRDLIIIILGILSGTLCLACAVLITKVLQLRRRPRIMKRIYNRE